MGRVAQRFWDNLRVAQPPVEDSAALEQFVNAPPEELAAAATDVAEQVAPEAAPETRRTLALTLGLAAPVSRRVLTRADDAEGKTVPAALKITGPLVIGRFIPPGPPRFREGQTHPAFGNWVLRERLGVGGFSEVWRVQHPRDEPLCAAVKYFTSDEARSRLNRHEVAVLGQVRKLGAGAGIVRLEDFDEDADPPWIRCEYVPRGDLIRHAKQFSGASSTGLIRELAGVVGRCHRLTPPVVHRDLKPGNVLMRAVDGRLCPVVADFGIGGVSSSLELDQARTISAGALPTILAGSHTALYASPQQFDGAAPDPRDDVFALGVMWYQLAVGDLSSPAPSGLGWAGDLKDAGFPEALVRVLGDCVEPKKVERRPKDAAELAERIADAAGPIPRKFTSPTLNAPFALVPAGEFWMGGGDGRSGDRLVVMDAPFYIGVHPVTQGQWKALMGTNPSHFRRGGPGGRGVRDIPDADLDLFPVEGVSWDDAQMFIERLNARERQEGWVYRLPAEEEWEYAARSPVPHEAGGVARTHCGFSFYSPRPADSLSSGEANFNGNYPAGGAAKGPYLKRTAKVGSYPANALGVHDLFGNVWEWTQAANGAERKFRGGGWFNGGEHCTAANWNAAVPETRRNDLGLRLARVKTSQE